ncbi:glycosyltransferase family 8 protein [Campylobacter lari]|uniref:glycosyltransferase family 8 protein n=1 Tax=Campylobacter lari TaxID=201 RepID=UPI000E17CA33|nr:glycosyltransferase family 8 protein [Campylobacter lari]SUX06395.1 lipopolysaccharide 1,3-galactosyltransferase [Campylobacter lari]
MINENAIDNYYKYVEPLFDDKIAIVFSVDKNYINYLCVTLESLKRNSSSKENYDIVVLYSDLENYIKNIIVSHYSNNNFSIRFFNVDDVVKQINSSIFYTTQHFTIAVYYRFFIPNLFKQYKKVIYADCDAIFLEDVALCYKMDLKDNLLAAVLDIEIQKTHFLKNDEWSKNFINYLKNDLQLKDSKNYFNSGFLIFNIQKCLKFNLLEKCIAKLEEIKTPIYVDQCILNKVTESKVYYIDLSWNVENHIIMLNKANLDNFPETILKQYLKSLEKVKFLHFSGSIKPWQNPKSYNAHFWWQYAYQTPFYKDILLKQVENAYLSKTKDKMKKYKNKSKFLILFVNIRLYVQYKVVKIIYYKLKFYYLRVLKILLGKQ